MNIVEHHSEVTVTYSGFDFTVQYDYSPEEPAQHYGDAPYPGCPEEVQIVEVLLNGEPIGELLREDVMDEIYHKVLEARQ